MRGADARLLERLRVRQPIGGLKLTGNRLIVLSRRDLLVYEVSSGRLERRLRLSPGGYSAPRLEDAYGGFAAYSAGVAIHIVRLSDGLDRALALAHQAGPVRAQLEQPGLYYSYGRAFAARPGRVAFIPMRRLAKALSGG